MNKNNKIAIIVYNFSEGGLERIVSNSTYAFQKMGYEVHLYVLSSHIGYPFAGTMHQYPVNKLSKWQKIKSYFKFAKSLKKENFAYIIDHRCRLNPLMEIIWAKVFYHKQNVFHYIHSSMWQYFLFRYNWFNQWLYGKGTFISVSEELTKKIKDKFPKISIKTIHNFFLS